MSVVHGRANRMSTRSTARLLLATVVPVFAVAWLITHWAAVDTATDQLGGATRGWLLGAVAVAAMTWIAGAVCQQGAVVEPLPGGRLLAVQFAGSAANHVLPAGIGVATVNLRFLRRTGLSSSSALNAVGLNTCAGITVHLLVLAGLILAGFAVPRAVIGTGAVGLIVAGVAGAALLLLAFVPTWRRRYTKVIWAQVHSAAVQWAVIGRRPARTVQLCLGSAAVPVLHATTLAFVAQALHAPIGVGPIFGIYFLASAVSAAVPSPGGFGALDAALIVALSAGGLGTATAVAAVVAYRLITVWIPLLPSACVLSVLYHRGVI